MREQESIYRRIPSLRDSMVMPTREQVVSVKTDTEQDSDLKTTEQLPASWLPARGQVTGRVMEQQVLLSVFYRSVLYYRTTGPVLRPPRVSMIGSGCMSPQADTTYRT